MNNTCLLLALGVVIFVIMQNKGGSKGSLSIKSLSKSSKSVMNTNVPIICVGVLFLVYMFMNNGGIEGFTPTVNSCGISKTSADTFTRTLTDMGKEGIRWMAENEIATANKEISTLTRGVGQTGDCPTQDKYACNMFSVDGNTNNDCGYFYISPNTNDLLMPEDVKSDKLNKAMIWKAGFILGNGVTLRN